MLEELLKVCLPIDHYIPKQRTDRVGRMRQGHSDVCTIDILLSP